MKCNKITRATVIPRYQKHSLCALNVNIDVIITVRCYWFHCRLNLFSNSLHKVLYILPGRMYILTVL